MGIQKKLKFILGSFLITILMLSSTSIVLADNKPTQTEVSKYALSWDGHTEMPYIYAGPGGRSGPMTLEECSAQGVGFDCSAFTSMVYRNFGIEIPAQSNSQKSAAVKVFTDESEAVPGDICWWGTRSQHVGIYIGDGKIMHTNTSRPPYNYPHVSEFATYDTPEAYLRMVDDISQLKPLNGNSAEDTQEQVENTEGYGSIITESDLTGMPSKSSLLREQTKLELKGRDNLTKTELATLSYISTALEDGKQTPSMWYHTLSSVVGMFFILYGVLLLIAYMFDYSNVFLEFSILKVISFGKFTIINNDDVTAGAERGWSSKRRLTYLTPGMMVARVAILFTVGCCLLTGMVSKLLMLLIGG